MEINSDSPIGVFDSGLGGLTVVSAIKSLIPNERIVYFGDTAHLPYGEKSADSIRFYSKRIADFLLSRGVKVLLIACNTASAFAFEEVKEHVANKALVMNVIDPVIENVVQNRKIGKIAIIGTKGTTSSGTYPKKLLSIRPDLEVVAMATPLLVPMIEEGFIYDDISNAIIRSYLSNERLKNIDSLILGCTHYPIIKNQIRKYYNFNINVIDSSLIVAQTLKNYLVENEALNSVENPKHKFYVSDYTEYFKQIAEMFFDDEIDLEQLDFWK